MIYSGEFTISTNRETEFLDITLRINEVVSKSGLKDGIVTIFTKHTTTAIGINENESRILKDYEDMLKKLIAKGRGYRHDSIDSNTHSHLRSLILGSSKTVPIENGRLSMGTWQSIFFIELDGPRQRTVVVKVIGE